MSQVILELVGGDAEAEKFTLALPTVIGRGRESGLNLDSPLVSRCHCELLWEGGWVIVRDLESRNGTFIGSHRIEQAMLKPGDLLTVGTVTFRARYAVAVDEQAGDGPAVAQLWAGPPDRSAETVRVTGQPAEQELTERFATGRSAPSLQQSNETPLRPTGGKHPDTNQPAPSKHAQPERPPTILPRNIDDNPTRSPEELDAFRRQGSADP